MTRWLTTGERRDVRPVVRLALAVTIGIGALTLSAVANPLMARVPSIPLFAGVLIVAWLVGFVPAVFVAALGAVVLGYLVREPGPGWHITPDVLWLALLFVVATAMAWFVSMVRDLQDERARLLEREQQARAQAEAASNAKNQFLAAVSHELRTPLTAILGWVRLLKAGTLSPAELRRAIETIERNTAAQAELIDDLLDASRALTGKFDVILRDVDLADVARDAACSVDPGARGKGVVIDVRLEAPLPVLGDDIRLRQLVTNLLSNAIKFTPAGGRIVIEGERGHTSVRLAVRDSGDGIEPTALSRIFEHAHHGGARRVDGLGLGLAISRHIVEAHGGSIGADSAGRGRGATFTVTLPHRVVTRFTLPADTTLRPS
jgi:signal transduction histidine kinase